MIRKFLLAALMFSAPAVNAIEVGGDNVVSGDCDKLAQRIKGSGVTDAAGSHPGRPGSTNATIEPEIPTYKYSVKPGANGEICASASVKVRLKVVSVSTRLDWQPSPEFAKSCNQPRKTWINTIEAHEADHVKDNRRLESEYNKGVKAKSYSACDSTQEGAAAKLKQQIEADVSAAEDQLSAKITQAADDYHAKHGAGVERPNCCKPNGKTYCPCNNPAQGKPRNYETETECAVKCPSGLACFATRCSKPPN